MAGDERRLSPQQIEAFAVSEAEAEAFIALEIDDVLTRFMPVFVEALAVIAEQSDPAEVEALLAGVEQTLAAVTTGDVAAIERFRERAVRVSGVLETRGRHSMAEIVRKLPDTMVEVLGRRRRDG